LLKEVRADDLGQYGRIELPDGERRSLAREDFDAFGKLRTSGRPFQQIVATSSGHGGNNAFEIKVEGKAYLPTANRHWSSHPTGMDRLVLASRLVPSANGVRYVRFFADFTAQSLNNVWADLGSATDKSYVVETAPSVVERCMLMTTDPGDLVFDPTCGSGTTAFVAEQWGRRWITTDTSRVALALARTRLTAGRFPAYLLRDSREGAAKEGEITGRLPEEGPFRHDIRQGLVLERVPHVTLKSIANNAEIDVIHANWAPKIEAALAALNTALGTKHAEWQVPRNLPEDAKPAVQEAHAAFWATRRARQAEMDASIARNADTEFLHDRIHPAKTAGAGHRGWTGVTAFGRR
jgi:adenine-specific DNA-methyltransferase